MATGYRQTDERIPEWLRDDLRRAGRTIEPFSGGSAPRRIQAGSLKQCGKCGEFGHNRTSCRRVDAAGVVVS